jgi:hypothetical protein
MKQIVLQNEKHKYIVEKTTSRIQEFGNTIFQFEGFQMRKECRNVQNSQLSFTYGELLMQSVNTKFQIH